MMERMKELSKIILIVGIWISMGIAGWKLGLTDKSYILPSTIGGTIAYLVVRDMKKEKGK